MEAHGDVAGAKPDDASYFFVSVFFEPEGEDGLVDGSQAGYEGVEQAEVVGLFVACGVVGDFDGYVVEAVDGGPAMAAIAPMPGDARVDGRAIDPCRHLGVAAEGIHALPKIDEHFLIKIVEGGVVRHVHAAHLGYHRFILIGEGQEACFFIGVAVHHIYLTQAAAIYYTNPKSFSKIFPPPDYICYASVMVAGRRGMAPSEAQT